jgi:hypothetical protein
VHLLCDVGLKNQGRSGICSMDMVGVIYQGPVNLVIILLSYEQDIARRLRPCQGEKIMTLCFCASVSLAMSIAI